jgi:hypothetical protein
MRSRKPCTRARRRLFGWNVRLPLATAFSSLCLASPSGRHAFQLRWSAGRSGCFALLAGAVPGQFIRIAAVSPTFGRLFEGTDEPSPGQTPHATTRPHRTRPVAKVWPATIAHTVRERRIGRDTRSSCRCKERHRNATELLAAGRKTVSFGQCRFDWSGGRPRSEDGRSTSCPDNLTGCLQRGDREPLPVGCGTLRDRPFHTCG